MASRPRSSKSWTPRVSPTRVARAVVFLVAAALASGCTTQVVETTRAPAAGSVGTVTQFGYKDGEIVVHFTPRGEELATPFVNKPPGRLMFGVDTIDQLHTKYRANALIPLERDGVTLYRIQLSPDANVLRAAAEYDAHPLVLRAQPNYAYTIQRPPEATDSVRTRVQPRH